MLAELNYILSLQHNFNLLSYLLFLISQAADLTILGSNCVVLLLVITLSEVYITVLKT